jgi:hypothetical protein
MAETVSKSTNLDFIVSLAARAAAGKKSTNLVQGMRDFFVSSYARAKHPCTKYKSFCKSKNILSKVISRLASNSKVSILVLPISVFRYSRLKSGLKYRYRQNFGGITSIENMTRVTRVTRVIPVTCVTRMTHMTRVTIVTRSCDSCEPL